MNEKQFSNWLLGLAVAGFILVITQGDKVAGEYSCLLIGHASIYFIALIFLVSLIVGGLAVYYIDKKLECLSIDSAFIMRQEVNMLSLEPKSIKPGNLIEGLQKGQHLKSEKIPHFKKNQDNSEKFSKKIRLCLLLQPCLTIGGYTMILILYGLGKWLNI